MQSPSALTEHGSLNLAGNFLVRPCILSKNLYWARKYYLYEVARMLQVEAEVVRNNRNQLHQTTNKHYSGAQYKGCLTYNCIHATFGLFCLYTVQIRRGSRLVRLD